MVNQARKEAHANVTDEEKGLPGPGKDADVEIAQSWSLKKFASLGVETGGIVPIPVSERTNTRVHGIFTLWLTMSVNLLPIVTGMTGPLGYGLGLRDCSLIILFFSILCTIPVGYLATLGPKTGMRQMIQARFSFGYYLVSVPVILNLATLTGFCVIDSVIGGQSLSAVTHGHLTPDVGIVVIAILAMLVCFCGFKILHRYERFAWIPALIAIVIATGTGGKHLSNQAAFETPEASTILSFSALIAGFLIPWAALAGDFAVYMVPEASSTKVFAYTYGGLFLPTVPLMVLGAAIGGACPNVPSWQAGYESTSVGGVLAAMLEPAGGFGKFVVVLLAFSLLGNIAATMYSITLNFQLLLPWMVRVPRFLFAIVITAIVIPVAIRAATSFFDNLENFIGVIGYWASAFVAVVVIEHAWFRKSDCSAYDHEKWDKSNMLPSGLAALGASLLSFALVVPSMAQVWYTGPIAKTTGDIGFELAFVVTGLLYVPLRYLEIRIQKRV
ncbi:cytosine-purine permease [Aureobasidium pullulans]|nr:cytosine-purine permease [Aureobasidium pullulans]